MAILVAILLLGILTIWQVYLVAPYFLFEGAIATYILLIFLTLLTQFKFLWVYPVNGLLGLGLFLASVSQPEHFQIVSGGSLILPTFIIIVGDTLALLLGVTSLYVFWKRFSPEMQARRAEHRRVHADCAPDSPCKTNPNYRV